MKIKLCFYIFSACLVALMSLYPSTPVLARQPIFEDVVVSWTDTPLGACSAGYVILESLTINFISHVIVDQEGNIVRIHQQLIAEGGIRIEGRPDLYVAYDKAVSNATLTWTPEMKVFQSGNIGGGKLTVPGMGNIVRYTGRSIWVLDEVSGMFVPIYEKGKWTPNQQEALDAFCTYFGLQ